MIKKVLLSILTQRFDLLLNSLSCIHKSKPFIIYRDKVHSYRDILRAARQFASLLQKQGTNNIAFWGDNCPAHIIARLACHIAKKPFMPLHSDFDRSDIEILCNNGNIDTLITTEDGLSCKISRLKNQISPTQYNDIFMLSLSSGTTSHLPKIVLHTQKAWLNSLRQFINNTESNEKDIRFICLPPFATSGSVIVLPIMLAGGTLIIPDERKPQTISEIIKKVNATHIYFTPHWLIQFLNYIEETNINFSSLKRIIVGTEPLHPSTILKALSILKIPLTTGYGMVEALPPLSTITFYPNKSYTEQDLLSSGKILKNVTIKIQNKKIWVKSPTLANGYIPEKENYRFTRKGFQTSDYGYIDNKNRIFILGRDIDLIDGERLLFTRHIENMLLKNFTNLKDVCVVKYNNVIYIFTMGGGSLSKIAEKVKEEFPIIKDIDVIPIQYIPTKVTGKLNREVLYEKISLRCRTKNSTL